MPNDDAYDALATRSAEDSDIAERVRRLDAARNAERFRAAQNALYPDQEALQVWQDLWSEYWGPGDGIDWILGRTPTERGVPT